MIARGLPHKHSLPMHLDHFIERMGLFIIIVMGESVNGMTLEPMGSPVLTSSLLLTPTRDSRAPPALLPLSSSSCTQPVCLVSLQCYA